MIPWATRESGLPVFMHVFPVAITQIDWPSFLKMSKRSLTRELDKNQIPISTPSAWIAALGVFENSKATPLESIRDGEMLYKHLFFGFMIQGTEEDLKDFCMLAASCHLAVTFNEEKDSAIVSGTIANWKYACLFGCRESKKPQTRFGFCQCFYFFEQAGLRQVWPNVIKKSLPDGTFTL